MSALCRTNTKTVKPSVSLPEDLFEKAKAKAKAESRDFSKHVQHLIRKDLGIVDEEISKLKEEDAA